MTDDLIAFLRARLDETERLALAWPEMRRAWSFVGNRRITFDNGAWDPVAALEVTGQPADHWEQVWIRRGTANEAEFIAANDPARVLRQVEAHRARLDFLIGLEHDMGPEDFPTYDSCRLLVEPGGLGDLEVGYCSCGLDSLRSRLYKIEAMPYSDHPDFREEWA